MIEGKNGLIKKVNNGGITSPKGFKATGVCANIRKKDKLDVGIIISDVPASAAAVYTLNKFQAAPLKVTKESIKSEGKIQAIICNSGNANACTGEQGEKDAYTIRKETAAKFSLPEHYVAVASTGVIGELMPMDQMLSGIKALEPVSSIEGGELFSKAIMTTDLVPKTTCYEIEVDGKTVTVAGAAKGSGMIHPNMATMLGFVTTDALVESDVLQEALRSITNKTFNRITVDGDTSTNDMVLVMANGLAENETLTPAHPDWDLFYGALQKVCEDLAKAIARDGEGATKLVEVQVEGALSDEDAGKIAKSIVGSSLVKTAVHGADANWGRIIAAVGYAGVEVDPTKVDVFIGDIQMLKESQPIAFSEEDATNYLKGDEVVIKVHLHLGEGRGKAWGCDLSYDYVRINASYRS
ncbi:bifunctional glutamate N-acetyltransferase/amino-acid acetyltransferase ArgJ [Calidifontibacillus erzurumensis]|uniref:Arginine biosynthesis bifunctional protein ArgJ n=1 Tax=Calidifontibacillus erzurumensis TaxID=2741433 RepID=A0A8J8K843_9BACI|nr:bifunctional glutamate N-acetyltransferase/amino-acid acetyltransferase ArgJ [Calidifontibacillus erzurumensis]NSL51486.1 bifunctional glutamate N-acetyltransferase/amino-acid acetyltransferase ArgJ [Calidifontibacillus erzurumensis]